MSNLEASSQVNHWLKQGMDAARAGDNSTARELLERVVQHDQRSEKGWFWLAAVVDDIKEKKICLGNVLTINPGNERARNLLHRLQAIEAGVQPAGSMTPGVSAMPGTTDGRVAQAGTSGGDSRTIWYVAAGLGAVATLALIAVLVMMMGGEDNGTQGTSPDQSVQNPTLSVLPPDVTPTASRTPAPPPATWTPAPTNTAIPAVPPTLFPPAPAGLGGKIIMQSGSATDPKNQPITIINPDGSNRQVLTGTERGHSPWLAPDGNRFVYIKYAVSTLEYLMQFDNLQGSAPQFGTSYWGRSTILLDPDHPTWSPDGSFVAFTAKGGSATPDLYWLSLLDPTGGNPEALRRLTQDGASESWPAFSPDGKFIVYAVDLSPLNAGGGTELRIYNLAGGTAGDLTTNGAALIEAAPDWSPDASQIVFQGKETGAAADIYLIPAVGGVPQKIIDSDYDDIQPRFSPDGRYIVFSSNRTGNWDVFVYEIATGAIYQVTTDSHTDIANDWGS